MGVIATAERGTRIGEHLVINCIIVARAVDPVGDKRHREGARTEIVHQGCDGDGDDVVAKAAAARPAPTDRAIAEPCLHLARQRIPAENTETTEPSVVRGWWD